MIAFGDEGSSVISGSVRLAPGLGLTNRFVIDQHFRQRDRLGRLITALAYNPFAVGIGLDEDTAVFIGPDETLEVEGSGGVTIVDAYGYDFFIDGQRLRGAARLHAGPARSTFSSPEPRSTCTRASRPPIICDPRSNRACSAPEL